MTPYLRPTKLRLNNNYISIYTVTLFCSESLSSYLKNRFTDLKAGDECMCSVHDYFRLFRDKNSPALCPSYFVKIQVCVKWSI